MPTTRTMKTKILIAAIKMQTRQVQATIDRTTQQFRARADRALSALIFCFRLLLVMMKINDILEM
jgi:hypothetical protein